MFFELSKIFWTLAQPANFLFVLLALTVILLWVRPRFGRVIMTILVVCAWLAAALPIGEYYIRQIENTYPIPELPAHVDGIILLGGFVWSEGSEVRQQIQTDNKADRYLAFAKLAQKYPDAKLVFTGGSGNPLRQDVREADYVRQLWADMGYDPARVIWERESRNTFENAVNSKKLVQPQPGQTWLLVTSAMHMPRSVAIFTKQDWAVVPYPVDFISTNGSLWQYEFSVTDNLWRLATALKEIIGRKAYQLTGKAA